MTINKSLFSSLPQFPTLRLGSCLHEPITHIPWFVSPRTIYILHTHLGSCFYKPIIHSIRLGSCLHYALVRVFTNQLPTSLGSCLHEPFTCSTLTLVHVFTNQLFTPYALVRVFTTPWFVSSLRLG